MKLVVVGSMFAIVVISVSCAENQNSPPPAVASIEVAAETQNQTCSITAVSPDYATDHEKTNDPWIRDSGESVSIVLAQRLELVGPGRDVGSAARFFFKNGNALPYPEYTDATIASEDGLVCNFEVGYSNRDFNEMLDLKRNQKLQSVYPKLVLQPGKFVAHQVAVMESARSTPIDQMPGKVCDAKPKTLESIYDFSFNAPVTLHYPNGKPSESKLFGFSCRGYNQRLSDLRNAIGDKIVTSVER